MVAHNRKVKTVEELAELWAAYKAACDDHIATLTEFSQRHGDFVTKEVHKPVSYTIDGFCNFIGLTRHAFYENYAGKEPWANAVARIRAECEVDARRKFETGQIPSQLAGLWMSNYGYGTLNAETEASNLVDEWVEAVKASDTESALFS